MARGEIVETDPLEVPAPVLAEYGDGVAGLLRHAEIPFVSYPYEWPFGMLRDAALLQLALLVAALDEDVVLKDASPYNVQWRGASPVFIDVGSFEPLRPGEPWAGYRQFCMLALYPLMLQAFRDVPFHARLRGSIDGIPPQECRNLLGARDLLRRGVLTHVVLHARLERRYAAREADVKQELRAAGFRKELVRANAAGLARIVGRLRWKPKPSAWSSYTTTTTYAPEDAERKAAFVREAVHARRSRLVWDLGCNDGTFSRIAAENADYVIAVDGDHAAVDGLYRSLRSDGATGILPLVMNVADPSPRLGWRGRERKALPDRGRPDLTLCLALLHHVVISANVPLREFLDWLRSLGTALVIEFPTPEDPMVRRLLAAKRPGTHADYERETFERALAERFDVERVEALGSATRMLYLAHPAE